MKFKELVDNPSLENKIKFKKYQISIQENDIYINGDDGFGTKTIRLENMKEDLERLKNEFKRDTNKKM